jgi:Domain of Unknown Function (DUF1206)
VPRRGFPAGPGGRDGHALNIARTRDEQGRRASGSPAAKAVARAGLTARGLVWVLIGCVAALVALGQARQEANQQGALQLLARQPLGSVLLWVLGIGFVSYALWCLSQAAFGVAGEGSGAGPVRWRRQEGRPVDVEAVTTRMKAAALEVDWWRVHREMQRATQPRGAGDELVESVTRLYSYLYGEPEAEVRPAAVHRARAMDLSDQWIREGCRPDSPLLPLEHAALVRCYAALLAAVHH